MTTVFHQELLFRHLEKLQRDKRSQTVVVRSHGYTARGIECLIKIAQAVPRHRFVLVVHSRSIRERMYQLLLELNQLRNVFLGFVGIEKVSGLRIFKTEEEGYDVLTKRASRPSAVATRPG